MTLRLASLKPRIAPMQGPKHGWAAEGRGSRHERGYGSAWDRQRAAVLKRDCYTCQPCKADGTIHAANIVDHRIPKAEGGTDDPSNLWAVCSTFHKAKTQTEATYGMTHARGGSKP